MHVSLVNPIPLVRSAKINPLGGCFFLHRKLHSSVGKKSYELGEFVSLTNQRQSNSSSVDNSNAFAMVSTRPTKNDLASSVGLRDFRQGVLTFAQKLANSSRRPENTRGRHRFFDQRPQRQTCVSRTIAFGLWLILINGGGGVIRHLKPLRLMVRQV